MKIITFCGLAFLGPILLACAANAYSQTSTPAQRDAARDAVFECAKKNWADFDDRVSPAPVIAKSLAVICRPQIGAWADVTNQGMPPEWRDGLFEQTMSGSSLIPLVLLLRTHTPKP